MQHLGGFGEVFKPKNPEQAASLILALGGMGCFWIGRLTGSWLMKFIAPAKLLGGLCDHQYNINFYRCNSSWLAKCDRSVLYLFFYVADVPDHFCSRHTRIRSVDKKSFFFPGYGSCRRRFLSAFNGFGGRSCGNVHCIYYSFVLFCFYCILCSLGKS